MRFAVVGCGNISEAHIDSIKKIEGAQLVAVWSRTAKRAQEVAAKEGCEAVESIDRLVERDDVDIVVVCTPSGFHLEPALKAIRSGKHVLVEKPLEITEERCAQLIEAADEHNVKLGVIFQSRFAPANRAVYEAVRAGRFGRMVLGDAYVKWFRSQEYYASGAWRGTWELDGGGALMNQAIHSVDLLLWLMGPVKSVFAHADCLAHTGIEVEDTVAAVLRFESGAIGVIEATTSVQPGYPKRIEVHGSKGGAVLVDDAVASWHEEEDVKAGEEMLARYGATHRSGTASDPMAMSFDNHRRQIEDFIEAVKEGRRPLIDGREGAKSVAVVRAIYRSAESGEPVVLS